MTIEIDSEYKIDQRKVRYQEPTTNVGWLVQQPEYRITGVALANAYMADYRKEKKRSQQSVEQSSKPL